MNKKTRTIIEIIIVAIALAIAIYVLQKHTPYIIKLMGKGNVSDVEKYIRTRGNRGRIVLISLQVLETISIVLPAMPVYICAGAVYGKLEGTLMCWLTNIVMNLIIFEAARRFKLQAVHFSKADKNPGLDEMMKSARYPGRLVLLMCALPIIPNGMIPYISAHTGMKVKDFMIALSAGCLPSILIYVCGGDLLLSEHFKITAPLLVAVIVVVAIAFRFKDRITSIIEKSAKRFLGITK